MHWRAGIFIHLNTEFLKETSKQQQLTGFFFLDLYHGAITFVIKNKKLREHLNSEENAEKYVHLHRQ